MIYNKLDNSLFYLCISIIFFRFLKRKKRYIIILMKTYKPLTPSLRQLAVIDHRIFTKKIFSKSLFLSMKKIDGRDNNGHITVRHRAGWHKRQYRLLDYKYNHANIKKTLLSFEYDPFRSGFVGLFYYQNGILSYQLLVCNLTLLKTSTFYSHIPLSMNSGDSGNFIHIFPGSLVCNVEIYPYKGGVLSRSAGTYCTYLKKEGRKVFLKIRSGKIISISTFCRATLGSISNKNHRFEIVGSAGRNRYLGIRPSVRGVAMNPIDHPHGGGEGKKSKKSFSRSVWGCLNAKRKKRYYLN